MRLNHSTTTALVLATLLTVPLAAAARPIHPVGLGCTKVYAEASTTWIKDPGVELGEINGTLNGAFFLAYDDAAAPIDPAKSEPNLVIYSKSGEIRLWVYSDSTLQSDGSYWRVFKTLASEGTGAYEKSTITLQIAGACFEGEGGSYVVTGTICPLA